MHARLPSSISGLVQEVQGLRRVIKNGRGKNTYENTKIGHLSLNMIREFVFSYKSKDVSDINCVCFQKVPLE